MKVIIYQDQNKFTVDNISIPDIESVSDLMRNQHNEYRVLGSELEDYNFQITATRGAIAEDEDIAITDELAKEIEEGIFWKFESVN
jgi:hypothetical protein